MISTVFHLQNLKIKQNDLFITQHHCSQTVARVLFVKRFCLFSVFKSRSAVLVLYSIVITTRLSVDSSNLPCFELLCKAELAVTCPVALY